MIKGPMGGNEIFKTRRQKYLDLTKDGISIFFSQPEQVRNNDVHHHFRQDSAFYYLSGFTEPESVLVLDANSPNPFTMFVRERDATRELWDGFRYGIEGAAEFYGPHKVYPIGELEKKLPDLIKNSEKIYYKTAENPENDRLLEKVIESARKSFGRSGRGNPQICDAKQIVGEMRLHKSSDELMLLKQACIISAEGHIAAMKVCKPGMFEYQLDAEITREFKMRGSERIGYGSIVGGGSNATVLHYVFNSDELKKDDLVLIDAGAEYGYYTGDITRTFPISGKFSKAQKQLYEAVLRVQKDCIDFVKPGVKLAAIHQHAIQGLVDQMLDLKLLKGNKTSIIEKKEYLKYYPHGTGHWLGMDVHDSGLYSLKGEPRELKEGMCFTIEPGLYIPKDDQDAPAEYRGIGIRIEDDIAVNKKGLADVLTELAPKEIDAMESIIGSR
jgi:Xaa-Pro aminopeptidase